MDSDVSNKSQKAECLPFGVYGPPRWRSFHVSSGSVSWALNDNNTGPVGATTLGLSWVSASFAQEAAPTTWLLGAGGAATYTGSVAYPGFNNAPAVGATFAPHDVALAFPQIYLRVSSSLGNNQAPGDAFWGANTTLGGLGESIYDRSTPDVLRQLPSGIDDFGNSVYNRHDGIQLDIYARQRNYERRATCRGCRYHTRRSISLWFTPAGILYYSHDGKL